MMNATKIKFYLLTSLSLLFFACQPRQPGNDSEIDHAEARRDSLAKILTYNPVDLSMFPAAKKGYKRVMIQVPVAENEDDLKIEFKSGLVLNVDLCNSHFLTGKTTEITGWGYSYYEIESEGKYGSTKMACQDTSTIKEFVHLEPVLTAYNSKIPIVLYIPEKLSVEYRIWKAGQKIEQATEKPH